MKITEKAFYLDEAFKTADTILKYTIQGITNIIFNRGIVNLDFNDLKTTLANKGNGHLGIGTVPSGSSILEAVKQAIHSPLLDTSIKGASNIILNSSGHINLMELNEAVAYVRELAGDAVNIIWGTVTDTDQSNDEVVITLIATGMDEDTPAQIDLAAQNTTAENKSHTVANKSPTITSDASSSSSILPTVVPPKPKEVVIPSFLQDYHRKNHTKKFKI